MVLGLIRAGARRRGPIGPWPALRRECGEMKVSFGEARVRAAPATGVSPLLVGGLSVWPAFGRVYGEMKVSFGKAVSSHRTLQERRRVMRKSTRDAALQVVERRLWPASGR
jgi:hypothetical protein